ncbi:hypothetical protein D9M69_471620 [compost metagenome]
MLESETQRAHGFSSCYQCVQMSGRTGRREVGLVDRTRAKTAPFIYLYIYQQVILLKKINGDYLDRNRSGSAAGFFRVASLEPRQAVLTCHWSENVPAERDRTAYRQTGESYERGPIPYLRNRCPMAVCEVWRRCAN